MYSAEFFKKYENALRSTAKYFCHITVYQIWYQNLVCMLKSWHARKNLLLLFAFLLDQILINLISSSTWHAGDEIRGRQIHNNFSYIF